jgi:hypothetical protein
MGIYIKEGVVEGVSKRSFAQIEAKLLRAPWYPRTGGGEITKNLSPPQGEFFEKTMNFLL